VMEKGTGLGNSNISTDFARDHARQVRHFDGVGEDILRIARAEVETAEDSEKLRIKIVHFKRERCFLALLLNNFIDALARFLDRLFDLSWLDAAVSNQMLECFLRHGAANWVERGKSNRVWRIINDHFDACRALKCFDIATFFADDFT